MLKLKTKTLWENLSTHCYDSSLDISHLSVKGLFTQVTSYAVSYNYASHTYKKFSKSSSLF